MKQIKTLQDLQDVYRKHYNVPDDITDNDVFKYQYHMWLHKPEHLDEISYTIWKMQQNMLGKLSCVSHVSPPPLRTDPTSETIKTYEKTLRYAYNNTTRKIYRTTQINEAVSDLQQMTLKYTEWQTQQSEDVLNNLPCRRLIDLTKFYYVIEEEVSMTEKNLSFMEKYAVDPKDVMFTLKLHAISDIDSVVKLLAGYEYREDGSVTPTFYRR